VKICTQSYCTQICKSISTYNLYIFLEHVGLNFLQSICVITSNSCEFREDIFRVNDIF
jgi:hypothetical protein